MNRWAQGLVRLRACSRDFTRVAVLVVASMGPWVMARASRLHHVRRRRALAARRANRDTPHLDDRGRGVESRVGQRNAISTAIARSPEILGRERPRTYRRFVTSLRKPRRGPSHPARMGGLAAVDGDPAPENTAACRRAGVRSIHDAISPTRSPAAASRPYIAEYFETHRAKPARCHASPAPSSLVSPSAVARTSRSPTREQPRCATRVPSRRAGRTHRVVGETSGKSAFKLLLRSSTPTQVDLHAGTELR